MGERRTRSVLPSVLALAILLAAGPAAFGSEDEPLLVPISGRITTERGEPIAGARVEAVEEIDWSFLRGSFLPPHISFRRTEPLSTRTGRDGTFRLGVRPGSFRVWVIAAGFQHAQRPDVPAPCEGLDVHLAVGGLVHGVVRAPDGTKVPGARVAAYPARSRGVISDRLVDPSLPPLAQASSDASGRFVLEGLALGIYDLFAACPGYSLAEDRDVDICGYGREPIEVRLRPERAIEALVLDADRRPIEGAEVELDQDVLLPWIEEKTVRTGVDGRFAFTSLRYDGNRILINAAGFVSQRHRVEVDEGERAFLEIVLTPTATVSGQVVGEAGEAVRGASLWAIKGPFGRSRSGTDANGRFTDSSVEPGQGIRILVSHPDYLGADFGPLDLEPGEHRRDVRIVLDPGGAVEGRVVDEEGEPIAGASIIVQPVCDGLDPYFKGSRLRSDPLGAFRAQGLEWGLHLAAAEAPGYLPNIIVGVPVRRGEPASSVEIRLETKRRLTGRVLAADGRPVSGATVLAFDTGQGRYFETRSDEVGAFILEGLSPHPVWFRIRAPSGEVIDRDDIPVGAGEVEIRLPLR